MAVNSTTTSDLNGNFKEAYADKIEDLLPEDSQLTKAIKFQGKDKELGDKYNQPVIVRSEQGFTYSRPNSGAFDINPTSTMKMQNALVDGFIIIEQSNVAYETVARSTNVNAFRNAVDLIMEDAMEAFGRRLEIALLYGQSPTGLGTINTSTNVDATHTTISFATGAWAGGMWTTLEGASLDIYPPTTGVALNTVGPMIISSIDLTNKTITVSGAAADITAIDAGTTVNGGYPRFYAAGTDGADEAVGLDKILTNTGTLFNINAATYSVWKANTYAVSGALTLAKIQSGVATAASRGLSEDVSLYVNPAVWQELSTEQVTYRQMDSSYSDKEAVNGFEALCFYSQNGKIMVYAHKYVKEGEAYCLPTSRAVRIGSSDVSFKMPGMDDSMMFTPLSANAGFFFRIYSQQSLFIETPAKCIKFTSIT